MDADIIVGGRMNISIKHLDEEGGSGEIDITTGSREGKGMKRIHFSETKRSSFAKFVVRCHIRGEIQGGRLMHNEKRSKKQQQRGGEIAFGREYLSETLQV